MSGHGGPGTRKREAWANWRRRTLRIEYPWLNDLDREIGGRAVHVAYWVLDPRLPCPPETWRRAFGLTMGVLEPTDDERERWASAAAHAARTDDPAGTLGASRWTPLWPRAWREISATLTEAHCDGWHTDGAQRVQRHHRRHRQSPRTAG